MEMLGVWEMVLVRLAIVTLLAPRAAVYHNASKLHDKHNGKKQN
jgi:hypothetical protein